MSFLAPLFLAGLAAVAVPVLIHLIQRERKQVVHFPSLMFVRRIPYQSIRRRRIHNWLLLLVRTAAIVLIVAAFARPFFKRSPSALAGMAGPREVVILLDRSYSMAYGDRWERARAAARQTVGALGPDDRASLILFARGAHAEARSTLDRASVLAAVDGATVGAGATRYGPALKLAQSILAQSQLPRREVVLVTDFQRIGWDGAQGTRVPDGTVVTPVPILDRETSNVAVASAAFQHAYFSGQERIAVTAGLLNRSAAPAREVEVALEIDGRPIETQRVTIAPHAAASVRFAPFTLSEPFTRGTVRSGADHLALDNAFHFVLSPAEPISVLIVEAPDAGRESSLYLTRALAIGATPSFATAVTTVDRLTDADLQGRAVAILNDVPGPRTGAQAARLNGFVERGGGLLIVAGERATWPSGPGLLPGSIGPLVDRSRDGGAALSSLEYGHPVFELFKAPRTGDFSPARFYRYRGFTPAEGSSVLARFDDGTVALAERPAGRGRVMVWTSTFDNVANDLALKPVFLPFVQRTVSHLAGYTEPVPWLTVEQVLDRQENGGPFIVSTPSGRRVTLGDGEDSGVLELAEQGFYELRRPNTQEARPHTVAANLDPAESDLTALDPRELVGAITSGSGTGEGAAAGEAFAGMTPQDEERRQGVWWYLLLAGLAALALETAWSNRLSRGGR